MLIPTGDDAFEIVLRRSFADYFVRIMLDAAAHHQKPFDEPFVAIDAPRLRRRGWSVFVDELKVPARIGIHAHEHEARSRS